MVNIPHTIDVVIGADGQVHATVQGVNGPQCGDLSKFLDELGTVVEDNRTPEYYRRQAVVNRGQLRTGG